MYYPIFKKLGMQLHNKIIWKFGHGLHAAKRFSGRYETILWFTKTDSYVFNLDDVRILQKYPGKRYYRGPNRGKPSCNSLGKNLDDIWEVVVQDWYSSMWDIPNVKSNHPEKTIHPRQFSLELSERCILVLTNEDHIVFDPYMGCWFYVDCSCYAQSSCLGCNKEQLYVDIAVQRIKDYFGGCLRY